VSVSPNWIVRLARCFEPTVELADKTIEVGLINRSAVPWPPIIGAVSGGGGSVGTGGVSQPPVATPIAVVIRYNGVDITADVELRSATFTALVNGATGSASLKVRDDARTHSFTSGGSLTVDIGGQRMWGGFVTRAQKVYPFAAYDTDVQQSRYWQLQGVDYNILFNKRIVFDAAHPATKLSFDYAVGTYDDTIIADLFDNYLTLGGDGLSRAGVDRVDVVTLDIKGVTSGKGSLTGGRGQIASAGYTWKQAMDVISRATGAVYYIDPDKVLNYVDVDTPDAPYGLSDNPDGELGYQNFRLTYNGTALINDMLVWGTALGSDQVVFSRAQNSTSQTAHNVWQEALVTQGLYKQVSADLVSSSYLNGTPQNKRGHKDDAISFSCRVFEPFFRVGQKVQLTNSIYSYSDVLPIRRMDIKFINGNQATFDLILSHEIDQPWMIFEQLIPKIDFNIPGFPPIYIPPIVDVFPPTPGGCDCGVTDTFTRTVSDGWGTSDAGIAYNGSTTGASVNGNQGVLVCSATDQTRSAALTPPSFTGATFDIYFDVELTNIPADSSPAPRLSIVVSGNDTNYRLDLFPTVGIGVPNVRIANGDFTGNPEAVGPDLTDNLVSVHIRKQTDGTDTALMANVWDATGVEPAGWLVDDGAAFKNDTECDFVLQLIQTANNANFTGTFDGLSILADGNQIDRCTEYRFDNFDRTVAAGSAGVSDFGTAWTTSGTASVWSVNGTQLQLSGSGTGFNLIQSDSTIPPLANDEWTMRTLFKTPNLSSTTGEWVIRLTGFNSGSNRNCFIDFFSGAGSSSIEIDGGGGAASASFTFASNTSYYLKLYHNATTGELSVTIWESGTAEPGTPTATKTIGATTPVSPDFRFVCRSFSGTFSLLWDWIDFDYTGKPCYENIPGAIIDNFSNRTLTDDLGTSSGGYTYTNVGIGSLDTTQISADYLRLTTTDPAGDATLQASLITFEPSDHNYPLNLQYEGIFTFKFRTNSVRDSNQDKVTVVEWQNTVITATDNNEWTVYIYVSNFDTSPTEHGAIWIANGSNPFGGTEVVKNDWIADSWYVCDVEQLGSEVKVRVYQDGASVLPAWTADSVSAPFPWIIDPDPSNGYAELFFSLEVQDASSSGPQIGTLDIDDIIGPVLGVPPSPASSGGGAASGWVCESTDDVLVRVDSTHFQTTSFIVAASSEVYVDGYLQRPGIAREYTESTNAQGIIQFNDPVADGAMVKVCYNANGPVVP
jgi:hypothetical protein